MTASLEGPPLGVTIIAIKGLRAGIVSRQEDGYRFHASSHRFDGMDGHLFGSVGEARSAATHLAALEGLSPRALKPWP